MTSRLLSQIFNQNSASIYEALRQNDAAENSGSDSDDIEERAGMLPSVNGPEQGEDGMNDDDQSTFELRHQPPAPASSSFLAQSTQRSFFSNMSRSRGNRYAPPRFRDEEPEDNDEVPASLLFEAGDQGVVGSDRPGRTGAPDSGKIGGGGPGPATEASRKRNLTADQQWAVTTAQVHQRSDEHEAKEIRRQARLGLIDPKERALWKWANVENLDNFLNDVSHSFCLSHLEAKVIIN
jgi:autophagy-related protein 9